MIPILQIKNDYLKVDQWIPEEIKLHEKRGNIYYCRLNLVPPVLDKIAKEKEPVVLITDNGDITLSKIEDTYYCHTASNVDAKFDKCNIPKEVVKWFSTSLNIHEEGFQFLPLGILPLHYEILKEIAIKHQGSPRENLLYCNFGLTSQYRVNLFAQIYVHQLETKPIPFAKFAKMEWPPNVPWPEYGNYLRNFAFNLLTSKFCLCPVGMGIDTYRLWECLYMGCIPVLEYSPFVENLSGYKILVVNNFNDISEELLNEKYEKFSNKEYNTNLLSSQYYKDLINESLCYIC